MKPSIRDWGYAAGFLEGDGTLGLCRSTTKATGSYAYSSFVSVHNTELPILRWFKRTFGGNIAFYRSRANSTRFKGRRPVWAWGLQQYHHKWFVSRILPFLRGEKRKKARAVLEFRKYKGTRGQGHAGNIKAQARAWRRYHLAFG